MGAGSQVDEESASQEKTSPPETKSSVRYDQEHAVSQCGQSTYSTVRQAIVLTIYE
jgi:hypothetical protein